MKKSISLLLLISFSSFGQYTAIPDENFEKQLILSGIDSDIDGRVLTENISTVSNLYLVSANITDLTGIQDFVSLVSLDCAYNKLTSLNISKNTALEHLYSNNNELINLDVSKNTSLITLFCNYNQLTSLDVSRNLNLSFIYCDNNLLTTLDASKNTRLIYLRCNSNELTSLNIRNGNNTILRPDFSDFSSNNLSCIQVDDVDFFNTDFSNRKDDTASYRLECNYLDIQSEVFDKVVIYPNPSYGVLHIDNVILEKVNIYDSLGNLVKVVSFDSNTNNTISLSTFPKGVYFMNLQTKTAGFLKKIILQ